MKYENTIKLLESFAKTIVNNYKDKIKEYSHGKLFNTINFEITTRTNEQFLVTINLEEYWKYIEHGRRAGAKMPPISAIENWINYRQIIPRPMVLSNGKTTVPTVQQLAYLIARSISRNGIAARPFMSESIESAMEVFKNKLKIAVKIDIINTVQSRIKDSNV